MTPTLIIFMVYLSIVLWGLTGYRYRRESRRLNIIRKSQFLQDENWFRKEIETKNAAEMGEELFYTTPYTAKQPIDLEVMEDPRLRGPQIKFIFLKSLGRLLQITFGFIFLFLCMAGP